jgi:hypothetical protein
MTTNNERAADRRNRPRFDLFRRAALGVVVAVVGLMVPISPAFAAAGSDGTSNTLQFAVTSAVLDQAHHRVVVTAPAAGGLAGRHLDLVEVVTPQLTYTLNNTMISGYVVGGPPESLSLSYTTIKITYNTAFSHASCGSGVDVCLMEPDGIYL